MTSVIKEELHKLVLAIDPASRGFGYALFESPTKSLDWGIAKIRFQKNHRCFDRIKKLIRFYQPEVIILEDYTDKGLKHCKRIAQLIDQIELFSKVEGVHVKKYSRDRVREVFSMFDVRTKYEIAKKICEWLPEFQPRMPPKRKPWMSEDERMKIFDAVSFVLTFYYLEE